MASSTASRAPAGETTRAAAVVPCAGCGSSRALPLLHFPAVPVSGIYLDNAAHSVARFDLRLGFCDSCGLVSRSGAQGAVIDYAAVDRATARQMPDYAPALAQALRRAGLGSTAAIVEVGCNDGSFLAFLAGNGFTRLAGIEPSRHLAGIAAARGLAIEIGYCTAARAGDLASRRGPIDAVVCRHTLEHVPEPADLLEAIARLLRPGGLALIEVPDFDWVLETLAVHEVWDEHVSYFSAANLSAALARHGLEVLSCDRIRFRDTRNLVALARRAAAPLPELHRPPQEQASTIAGCATLADRWARLTRGLAAAALSWPRPVVAIGASHIQSGFIHFAELSGVVSALIDDDPRKAGRFVMLDAPRPVISTAEALATIRRGTVLRTAFAYPAWMDRIAEGLAPHGVSIVDPYAGAPRDTGPT